MKKISFLFLMLFLTFNSFAQSIIDWSPDYKLSLKDFQSSQTEINPELNSYSIYPGTGMSYDFQMSGYEYMFTKNFNPKVHCTFNKDAAIITAPDSVLAARLVKISQFSFDLCELYARKFRSELYEKKGTFSSFDFFKPIYEELQKELNEHNSRVMKASKSGEDEAVLKLEHDQVMQQINVLSEFCKECKPSKKKKK